ncbi:MAG: hypothetical protein ACI8RN_000737 [Glaciecola sp.]|jgi:hypothetical protein|uniref:DUF4956 domain-containing protein n=1 Tax=Congregibacter sp. TaxID=2744308 RepID=UPI0039E5F902
MNPTPLKLLLTLLAYFAVTLGSVVWLLNVDSPSLKLLPLGGHDALAHEVVAPRAMLVEAETPQLQPTKPRVSAQLIKQTIVLLATTLIGTILVMLPLTWTYSATRFETGPSKVFVQALLLMPICAATVVLLVQDSLALAFGLAALVAAVRFRVALSEAIDGVYIFAAICVGLAAGIGYLGVALVMAMIFSLVNAILWMIDYGKNPVDDQRRAAQKAKLAAKSLLTK